MYFSNNLLYLRKQNKMTQENLADILQYSFRNISKWENGISIPTYDILDRISKLFNVDLKHLMEDDLSKSSPTYKCVFFDDPDIKESFQRELFRFLFSKMSIVECRTIRLTNEKTIIFENFEFNKQLCKILQQEKFTIDKLMLFFDNEIYRLKLNGYILFYKICSLDNVIKIDYQCA